MPAPKKSKTKPVEQTAPAKRQSYIARTGRTPIGVTVDEEEHDLIRRAAKLDGRPKSQFVLRAALAEAKKILGEK